MKNILVLILVLISLSGFSQKEIAFETEFNVNGCSDPKIQALEQNDMGDEVESEVQCCTYRNLKRSIMVIMESEYHENGCIRGCHSRTYISKIAGHVKYLQVQLPELFDDSNGELRKKINELLEKDFNKMKTEYPDCLEGLSFYDVSWNSINLSISDNGFSFNADTDVDASCMVAGEMSARFTFEQIDQYIVPHLD
tara:strand:- start:1735 stop:2322 length:588 start_codon:yes stop_codon:yes gene_type:complete